MTRPAMLTGVAAAALLACTIMTAQDAKAQDAGASPASAPGPDQVLIRLKGVAGQTWRTEAQSEVWTTFVADGHKVSRGTSTILNFDSATDEVRPNGATVEAATVSRVRQEILASGVHRSLDSDDPASLAADDAPTLGVKRLAHAKERIERDDRGRVIDMKIATGDAAADTTVGLAASDMMASDAVILPEGPVRVGDSWDAQHREIPMAGVGRLNFVVVATLKQVVVRGGETRLLLTYAARDPVFSSSTATDGTTAALTSFEMTSEAEFSLDQGRFLFMEEKDLVNITLADPGHGTADSGPAVS